jgi:PAS domain S-box-containing protein
MKKSDRSETDKPLKSAKDYNGNNDELYRSLFENSMDAILLTGPDGTVFSANPAASKMFGWTEEEICRLGRNGLVDISDPRLNPGLQSRDINGNVFGEITMIRKNGEKFPVEISSNIFMDPAGYKRTSMIIRDISERKKCELTLFLQSEILKNIREGINLIRLSDETIVFTNPGFDRLFGYEPGELIGKNVAVLNAAANLEPEEIKQTIIDAVNQTGEWHGVIQNVKKNGEEFWCSVSVSVFNHHVYGKVCLSVHYDITSERVAELDLRASEEELRKSKELLEKLNQRQNEIRENERALISREVHDELGQSMTALKLDLFMMKKNVSNNPEALKKIENMISLISDTIKIVQRISSDLRPGILDDLGLVAAIEWYSDEFENRTGIKCRLELDGCNFSDSSISLTLFRVFQESLTNVIRHSRATSVVVKLCNSNNGTTLTIQDNGIGMTKEKIESYNSMGLINIYERVKQFNGKATFLSKHGEGTKLTVFIPLS